MVIPAWLLVLLAFLATHRLTRVVTADYITRPMRTFVNKRYGENRLSYLVTCDWCVSFWLAWPVAIVAILWGDNRVVLIALLALAASSVTGLLTRLEAE